MSDDRLLAISVCATENDAKGKKHQYQRMVAP